MAAPPSYEDQLKHYGPSNDQMQGQCSDALLTSVAKDVTNWRSDPLSIGDGNVHAIATDSTIQVADKPLKYLKRWKETLDFLATPECMVRAFLKVGKATLAGKVCTEVKESLGGGES